jgi:aspartate/methionine/tyrosine aminotransferase
VLNLQADELNQVIKAQSPALYNVLSGRGKAIYYPRRGILAQGAAARGKDINATIGTAYEDSGMPMVLPSLAQGLVLDVVEAFPYAPSEGVKPLRDKWQELIRTKNPGLGTHSISLPVVTCGVTHGLSMVGYLFVDEGEDILLSDLYWENYDLVFGNAYMARFKYFNLFSENKFDILTLRAALSDSSQKKIVLLNFPNNPSGYSPSKEEAREIIKSLKETAEKGNKLVVILDDSYFGLFFENSIYQESLFGELAQAHENLLAVKVDGITKEEYAWGFRVGFITYGIKNGTGTLYKALEDKTAGAIRGSISNTSHASQNLFLKALKSETYVREKERNLAVIKERYHKVKQILDSHPEYRPYFESLPFNSGYFMCLKMKSGNSEKIWQHLLKKYSTGVISYADQNLFRIAFASTPLNKIEKMFDNIYLACLDCLDE